ncbi:MAG: DNA mismatch repair protein MutS, partial [Bacteroidia bacterium]|nr:DNA mismatch repair protein MutS [Bacteroidia bacterium]
IKHFALLAESIREYVTELKIAFIDIPSLTTVIDTLDPEKKRIPHFYIYDQYSSVLASLRTQLNRMTANKYEEIDIEPIRYQAQRIEDEVRKNIAQQLSLYTQTLSKALHEVVRLDIVLAKAIQIKELGLCKPDIGEQETSYKQLFHPEIKNSLHQQNKDFQPVDISIPMQPTVITGANMAGKSVLLKSVALAQTMAQYGFYVAAQSATVVPVEQIVTSAGDGEDELQGLSSFAAEMHRLNTTIENTHNNIKQLVLIDELARTTNPTEGKAIVCGMLDFLIQYNIQSLITTHYSIDIPCRKLRVKGFTENRNNEKITISNINSFIDYSLEETTEKEVPHEAVKIAEIIGVDKDILERTKKYLKK